jgi:2-polyprenyl-3-methyl-5-hydroxy-6-metoxy-1,4-benzoquinol methylase
MKPKKNKNEEHCRLCGGPTTKSFDMIILKKYSSYFSGCSECGFGQLSNPAWLEDLHQKKLPAIDEGGLKRNILLAFTTAGLMKYLHPKENILDYGAGYGIYVRLLRDMGIKCFWSDRYCENIFAQDYEAGSNTKFSCITAFELLEHIKDSKTFFNHLVMTYNPDSILLTTQLIPDPVTPGWWYFLSDNGQHISFYSLKSLKYIADITTG